MNKKQILVFLYFRKSPNVFRNGACTCETSTELEINFWGKINARQSFRKPDGHLTLSSALWSFVMNSFCLHSVLLTGTDGVYS